MCVSVGENMYGRLYSVVGVHGGDDSEDEKDVVGDNGEVGVLRDPTR